MKTGKKLLTGSLLALCAALQGRGQIAPRPIRCLPRKNGTAVPQKNSRPVFSVDMYLKSDHKQVQEISTSLFVIPYRRIEPC